MPEQKVALGGNYLLALTDAGADLTAARLTVTDVSGAVYLAAVPMTIDSPAAAHLGLASLSAGVYLAHVDFVDSGAALTYDETLAYGVTSSVSAPPVPGGAGPFAVSFVAPASFTGLSTAACVINEDTIDDGPYACTVAQNPDGSVSLTVSLPSLPAGLSPGEISLQAGNWPLPQTDPTTFAAYGQPVTGTLTSTGPTATLDWDVVLAGPYAEIAEANPVLETGSTQPVHVKVTLTDSQAGSAVLLTGNSAVSALEMAIVHGAPQTADWLPAGIVTRAAGDATDGEYLTLMLGPGAALTLLDGTWHVFVRLTTTSEVIVLRAPGYLTVED